MTRIAILARHPRRSLTALATLVAAGAVVVGSGAVFSTQTANPSNTFASGILSQSNSNATSILTASNLVPGASHVVTGMVDIKNSGTVGGVFTLAEAIDADKNSTDGINGDGADRASNKLSHALHLTIADCGAWSGSPSTAPDCTTTTSIYDGAFDAVGGTRALSTYASGEQRRYKFSVYLPDGGAPASAGATSVGGVGDNAFSGAFTSATFTWNAVSN
jgi:spore coat-associated protein N